jgi:uncharacterized protein YndB with AHSA1/START domain
VKWVLIVLGSLVGLAALAALAGALLPRQHRTTRAVVLHQPSDSVWAAIRDFAGLPSWWPEMKQVERLRDSTGREVWRQQVGGFPMTLEVAEEQPMRRLVTRIVAPENAPFGGRWIYELEAMPGGTRLTVTEEGWIGNPIFRVMGHVMGLDATIKKYLRSLGRRFGEDVKPA